MKKVYVHPDVQPIIHENVLALNDIDIKIAELHTQKDALVMEIYKEIVLVHGDEIADRPILVSPSGEWFIINEF